MKYQCIKCGGNAFLKYSTLWRCESCHSDFPTFHGMPRLYLENQIGAEDKSLRDFFYNGLLGKFYQWLMPFLTLPARPINKSYKDWLFYFVVLGIIIGLIYKSFRIVLGFDHFVVPSQIAINVTSILILVLIVNFLIRHPYFFYLLLFAIPVKISLSISKYNSNQNFKKVHDDIINECLSKPNAPLKILDISTGTGNSLYRHGWMKLKADYTGLDLSQIMLSQCQQFMSSKKVPIDLIIGDATFLPFSDGYFDVALNYGAINGYSNIKKALSEMSRVVKTGGKVLFLDEQLYSEASSIERIYFKKVLSSHNILHHCPVEFLPANVKDVEVHQVYEFYYICTFRL